ncbi:MAG: HAMP domain-containing histidine kinase [Flavobacteriaceae bacterium]|nr:HAMP domain-containing histidine kinase [Flavobacteriaceae bacterium]
MKQSGIYKKLNKVFVIQLVFISLVTIASVFGAAKVVENVLIKQALIGEAEFFWNHYDKDPNFSLPKTMNLTGYMVENKDYSKVPRALKEITENYQRVNLNEKLPIAYFTEKDNKRLYLIFEEAQVSILALYFGIAPLIIVLLAIYLPAFYSYIQSKRAFSPIIQVIRKIETVNVNNQELESLNFDEVSIPENSEVEALIDSFENFSKRISDFVKRERNFSRYASHELRTPLTVLKGSIALLQKQNFPEKQVKVLNRMDSMVMEMQHLIESLLLLSREQDIELSQEPIIINDFLKDIVNRALFSFQEKNIQLKWQADNLIQAKIPEQLFSIVINNLVRNACLYSESDSELKIAIADSKIKIVDHGIGMNEEQLKEIFNPFYRADEHSNVKGFGLGLSIVEWICKQCEWEISFSSKEHEGTTAILDLKSVHNIS